MIMEQAVIFDMDGVLVDTVSLNWRAINQTLEPYGIHVNDEELYRYVGRPLKDQLAQLSQEYGVELDYDYIESNSTQIKKELMKNLAPKPGVVELLEKLKENHIPIAVATSNSREVTIERLTTSGILHYFDILVTEDDVTRHKPDPEVFEKAAQEMGVLSVNCLVFEDAPSGLVAAKSANMKCIAVETPFVRAEDIQMADKIVSSLVQVDVSVIGEVLAAIQSPEIMH
jgi:HAD superfamily hydrolase (TIGR01509 family)